MFKNYLKTAYRSLLKNKIYSIINIIGLAVGIACCLFIGLYIRHESSYDQFFESNERIHRISLERIYPDRVRLFASSPVTLAPTLLENYPEVEAVTRMHRLFFSQEVSIRVEEKAFIETKYYYADSNFFKVFKFEFLEGTPSTALNTPNKVVVTDKTAKRLFGTPSALNKTLRNGNDDELIIGGVIKDLPENSHLDFDLLGSIQSLGFIRNAITSNSWINPWVYTYAKLKEGIPQQVFEDKLPQMVNQHGSANIASRLGDNYAELGHQFNYFLQPIADIHLHSKLDLEVKPTSNASFIYLLGAIALFILLLSCINFINLTTARSSERAKEVGVRKVVGSSKQSIIRQFVMESVFSCFISFILALLIALVLLPFFNELLGQSLSLTSLINGWTLGVSTLFVAIIGLLAGLYPALVISSIDSATVLKGNYKSSNQGIWLRNGLIVFQFFITLLMISGSLFVSEQMKFMVNKDLGFDKNQVMIIRQAVSIGQNLEPLKNELNRINGVIGVGGGATAIPGDFMGSSVLRFNNREISDIRANIANYDDDFISVMKFNMAEGRGFERAFNDSLSVLVNQSFAKEMGKASPIGTKLRTTNSAAGGPELTIVGVIEDFNFTSLHTEVSPLIVFNGNTNFIPTAIAIRTNTQDYQKIIPQIEAAWDKFVPSQSIRLAYLNEELSTLYEADLSTQKVFNLFTYIAILIAFVGLFSLAAYIIQLRTKEISVRKILGASFLQIFVLLSKNFIQLVLLALLLSIPVTYYGIQYWLGNFAYHIDIEWLTFVKAGGIAILLVLAAISYQSIKIAFVNPAIALKIE